MYIIFQKCDLCGIDVEVDYTQNYSTLTPDDIDFRVIGSIEINGNRFEKHICRDCYEGSSYEAEELREKHHDFLYDQHKDRNIS